MDKQKLIDELTRIANIINSYDDMFEVDGVEPWVILDALKLLKEQEAIKPIPPTDESDLWRCGGCNNQLFRCTRQRYCEMCGQEVKWE